MQTRLEKEKQWHEEYFTRHQSCAQVPAAVLERYLHPKRRALYPLERMLELVGDVSGKKVLCYGCGDSNMTVILALKGAEVWALDVSEVAIDRQRLMARENGVENSITAVLGAGEALPLPSDSFDVVFGSEVLHHLTDSLNAASVELRRVLKPEGFAVFSEPVLRSKLVGSLRKLFPKNSQLTEDERQLDDADFAKFHWAFDCGVENFNIFSRLSKLFSRGPLETAPLPIVWVILGLARLDQLLLALPFMGRFAGQSVVLMRPKPKS